MKKLHTIIFLAFVLGFQVFAQEKKADKLYKYFNYSEAIPYYLKAYDKAKVSERDHIVLQLADCYRLTNNAAKAAEWYGKAIHIEGVDSMTYFWYGQALRTLGNYEDAGQAFKSYMELAPNDPEGERYYNYCKDIVPYLAKAPVATIKNIDGLNTRYSDFSPVFYGDGIVIVSDRFHGIKGDKPDKPVYGWTDHAYLDLYYTEPEYYKVIWDGVPEPTYMKGGMNQEFHDGPVCFSGENNQVFLTRTIEKQAKKARKSVDRIKTHLLKLFITDPDSEGKLKFKPFAYNSKDYSLGHPAVSPDGQTLIFASDMPGGYGLTDLYMSQLTEEGKWSEPVNLGDVINTEGEESFPYWAADGTLYFSSDGHLGFGGLDLFKAVKKDDVWTKPENLLRPINSSYDDFGIVLKEGMQEGMFSSNRPEGKGSDDIYGFRLLASPEPAPSVAALMVSGKVVDKNNVPLGGATVFLLDPQTREVKILKSGPDGSYQTQALHGRSYTVKAMKDGYIEDCTKFLTPGIGVEEYQVPRDLMLDKLEVNRVFSVDNIYYDLDKWYIRKDAEPELDKLVAFMKQYPITAELSSHTDSRASDAYNIELSQKRAESAVRYIVLQGVAPSRITAKGYGESQLVNRCSNGVACTEAEHQQNRRTEFKITSVGTSADGDFMNLDVYRSGDVVPQHLLGQGFFDNCMK